MDGRGRDHVDGRGQGRRWPLSPNVSVPRLLLNKMLGGRFAIDGGPDVANCPYLLSMRSTSGEMPDAFHALFGLQTFLISPCRRSEKRTLTATKAAAYRKQVANQHRVCVSITPFGPVYFMCVLSGQACASRYAVSGVADPYTSFFGSVSR